MPVPLPVKQWATWQNYLLACGDTLLLQPWPKDTAKSLWSPLISHCHPCCYAEPPTVNASPFASRAMGNMAELPSTSAAAPSSSAAMPKGYSNEGFGQDINLWYQPSSDAVTRAGDVLGMPHLDGYTAKVWGFLGSLHGVSRVLIIPCFHAVTGAVGFDSSLLSCCE